MKMIGKNTKSRKLLSVIPFLITIVMLLSSTLASCTSQTKPAESPISSTEQLPLKGDTAENKVRLTNGEWPPYLSEHLTHFGPVSRIATEAFALEGVEVEYGFFPWKRAYELAKSGDWDGSLIWLRTADREQYFYFSEPVMQVNYVFWHLKSFDFDWETIDGLHGVTIGGTRGYFYEDSFSSLENSGKVKIEWVSQDEQNFKKLLAGRIDLYVQDIDVGKSMQKNIFTPEERELLTYHPKPLRIDDMRLILSRQVEKNERLLTLFDRGLQRLRESGTIERYLTEAIGNEPGEN